MTQLKNDPIQEYILKNEHNLRIAVAVGEAWQAARGVIVSNFLTNLDTRLKRDLRGWESSRYGEFFVSKYPSYYVKDPRSKFYSIGLQAGEYGASMAIGICREAESSSKRPLSPDLLSAVQSIHPSARAEPWWEAKVRMNSPDSDWRKPEILWRIHTDTEFLEDVANQMLELARVCEPVFAELCGKSTGK